MTPCRGNRFKTLKIDPCVYIFNEKTAVKQGLATDGESTAILTLYVDAVLLAGGNKATLEMPKGKLSRFKVSYVENVSRVVGVQVTRDIHADSLGIVQDDYTRGLHGSMQDSRSLGAQGYGKEFP